MVGPVKMFNAKETEMLDGNIFEMDAFDLRVWLADKYCYEMVSLPTSVRMSRAIDRLAQMTGLHRNKIIAQAIRDAREAS